MNLLIVDKYTVLFQKKGKRRAKIYRAKMEGSNEYCFPAFYRPFFIRCIVYNSFIWNKICSGGEAKVKRRDNGKVTVNKGADDGRRMSSVSSAPESVRG